MGSLENKKVLITGGAGFIGSNLVEHFISKGAIVRCLDNLATGKLKNIEEYMSIPEFEFIEGDIRDIETCNKACKEQDIILHQAALGSVPRSINDPKTTTDVNIGGFVNMMIAAKDNNVKRFVYAASSSTYGDNKKLPKYEDNIGKPLSPYAITKYVNELYAQNFSELYGIETIGLRYFNVFGKKQTPEGAYAAAIPKFIKSLLNNESPIIYGDGTQSRDFTYIENVLQANFLAATSENHQALNQVYNVAFGENINLNDLLNFIKKELSVHRNNVLDIPVKYGPERKGDVKHSLASIDKAKKLLGYNPEYSIKDGLKKAIKWYYDNLK